MMNPSNGASTSVAMTPRELDEHLLVMRRVLEARLMAALDAYMARVDARLDQMMVDIEDALEPDDDADEEGDPFDDVRKRRRG